MEKVFVYGTLKKGQPGNSWMCEGENKGEAKYVGQAVTADPWPLVIAGWKNIPFLLDVKGTGKYVYGDVFEVDSTRLERMDEIERHPKIYKRMRLNVHMIKEDREAEEGTLEAWSYRLTDFLPQVLDNQFIDNYDASKYNLTAFMNKKGANFWDGVKEID